jgi:hypothetical protein
VVRRSQAGGGEAPSEGEPEDGRGARGVHVLGDRGDGRDHPGMEAIGSGVLEGGAKDGVRRLAAVVADERQPGAKGAQRGGGEPRTGQVDGSPRARAAPAGAERPAGRGGTARGTLDDRVSVASGLDGGHAAERGQPVGCRVPVRAGGVGSGAALPTTGGTGGITRAATGTAGPRGTSAAAGEGAAGRIVGVLGISRSTTGGSTSTAGAGRSTTGREGPPGQARYSPRGPAPQRLTCRSTAASSGRERRGCTGAGDQARCSPRGPAPQSAARRVSPRSSPTGAAGDVTTGAAGAACAGSAGAGAGAGRAIGAGRTERSGTVRMLPDREPAGRCAVARRREPEGAGPSARSRTSMRPARPPDRAAPDRATVVRAEEADVARSLLMSPPRSVRPRPGKVSRTRRKLGTRRGIAALFRRHWSARDRTVAQQIRIGR